MWRFSKMASRDRSQGFGFVYMNLSSFLSASEPWSEEGPLTPVPSHTINFNKDIAPVEPVATERPAVEKIRENLDRLQTLHQRLHVMLEEIGQIRSTNKKDPKGES
jgi:hypothetical protein